MSQNPYAPTAAPVAQHGTHANKQYHFKSLNTLSVVVMFFVGLTCFMMLCISALETFGFLNYANFTDPNAEVGSNTEMGVIYSIATAGVLATIAYLVAIIAGCIFCYRANANLRNLNVKGLKFTPGWCAGWWFVPIMNLFKPFQAVSETYVKSEQLLGGSQPNSLGVWWGFWIIGSIVNRIESRLTLRGVDLGGGGLALSWLSTLTLCAAGVLFIVIVRTITSNQQERIEKFSRG